LDSEKFATVTSEGMLEYIAQGLPMAERKLALAVQSQSYGRSTAREFSQRSAPSALW